MVLPPAVPDDEFDFDKMTPEEQLAWLESLARRQGARDEELITAADQDIPIPQDVEIDEPGYVPYSIRHDGPAPAHEAASETVRGTAWDEFADAGGHRDDDLPETGEEAWAGGLDEAQVEGGDLEEDRQDTAVSAAADPMRWLGDLAVRSDEDTVVHMRVEDQAGFNWGDQNGEAMPDEGLVPDQEEPEAGDRGDAVPGGVLSAAEGGPGAPVQPSSKAEAAEDFLGGVDPLLWLESLAARQGARSEELVTAADLSIDEPPPDVVIDEPGYVPFEASRMSLGLARGPFGDEIDQRGFADQELEGALVGEGDGGAWDEFLGADYDSFEALELSPADEGAAPQPGRDAFTWLESLGREQQSGPEEVRAPAESAPDALLWLEDLATEPESDLAEFLAMDDSEPGAPAGLASDEADPLAGMTDEQIEQALIRGHLSAEQELAWLQRQASRLAVEREAPQEAEADLAVAPEPASPTADLPAWVADLRPLEAESAEGEAVASLDLESLEAEAAPWLADMDELGEVAELPGGGPPQLTLEGDLEAAGAVDEPETVFGEFGMGLAGLDTLGEAADELYEDELARRERQGVATSWDADLDIYVAGADVSQPEAGDAETEPQFQRATLVEMPAWLLSEDETRAFDEADVPAWLRDVDDQAALAAADDQTWLAAHEAEAGSGWLSELDRPASAEMRWEEAVPSVGDALPAPPTRRATFPLPDSEQLAEYERRVAENPDDYGSRIALAGALWALDQVAASCAQYETLIENNQLLPDVINDLSALVVEHPAATRIHRMLGDAYLRRGRLKEALYSYRRALEQL
jgi:hypothetical protein